MDFYSFSLLLGGVGLTAMAVSGIGQRGHMGRAGRGARGGSKGQGHAGASKLAAARHSAKHGGHTAKHGGARPAHRAATRASGVLWALMSPKTIFSVMLGVGTTGLLLESTLSGIVLAGVSVAGGVAFNRLLVTPIWNFALRFASAPAVTLDSCITDHATAVTGFDASGHGVVAVELDGQIVQVLGTLWPADRAAGVKVRAGQRVRIEEVNAARNRCSVSAL
jgi:hypothetical protein